MKTGSATSKAVARQCAALHTRMAARNVTRIYDKALRPFGLKVTQFSLLIAIKSGTARSIADLANGLAMERTTLTRNLQLLEKAELISLGEEGYRRARQIELTRAGERTLQDALPAWQRAQCRVLKEIGEDRWENARVLLRELATIGT